jgi:hypothetical protein
VNEPLNAQSIVRQLSQLGRELDTTVEMLKAADLDAVEKRHAADIAESRAFVNAEGSVDLRKHTARLRADTYEQEALVAEALVRHLRQRVRALETRIDTGRSMGAALRAELSSLSYQEGP